MDQGQHHVTESPPGYAGSSGGKREIKVSALPAQQSLKEGIDLSREDKDEYGLICSTARHDRSIGQSSRRTAYSQYPCT